MDCISLTEMEIRNTIVLLESLASNAARTAIIVRSLEGWTPN
jgi:hypothetical protein